MARRTPVVRGFLLRNGVDRSGKGETSGSRSRSRASRPASAGCPTVACWWSPASHARVFRLEADGTLVEHGDLNPIATFYGNDMVVDAAGRAYVGNFGFDLDRFIEERGAAALVEPPGPPTTSLVRIDPDGSAHVAAEDLPFPNGTVITPDGRTLIMAETLAGRLTAFDVGDDGRADRTAGVGVAHLVRTRRHLPRRRGPGVGGQRHLSRVPPRGRGWRHRATGWPPPRPVSPACSAVPTAAPST